MNHSQQGHMLFDFFEAIGLTSGRNSSSGTMKRDHLERLSHAVRKAPLVELILTSECHSMADVHKDDCSSHQENGSEARTPSLSFATSSYEAEERQDSPSVDGRSLAERRTPSFDSSCDGANEEDHGMDGPEVTLAPGMKNNPGPEEYIVVA